MQKLLTGQWRFPEFGKPAKNGELPKSWQTKVFSDITSLTSPQKRIQSTSYQSKGKYPIVDQSQDYIVGYTDDESAVTKTSEPVVIFGDHTCTVKYVDFEFVQGADGIKIISTAASVLPKYLYQWLTGFPVIPEGYKRHYSKLKRSIVSIPLFPEQLRIAEVLTATDVEIAALQKSLEKLQTQKRGLMQKLLTGEIRV